MTGEEFKRKLTAILSADVAGYSRLMGEDEEATVRTLTSHRQVITTTVQQNRGRVIDSPGDNLLAEFASVVDAVQCAVEIQQVLKVRNAQLPEERKMAFRIGVNLGDVIQDGDRIYGDGVNIAARVEGLAEPGGICISGTVYEHIKNKLTLWNEYMGEHAVKNIVEPIRVYRIGMGPGTAASKEREATMSGIRGWKRAALALVVVLILGAAGVLFWRFYLRPPLPEDVASVAKMAFPLPDKPSIAVLPFVNMSGDAEQEYFADGMTEDLITDLSKISDLFVIARSSTFTYKGKPVKIQQVGEELGVRYVLEGSIRKADNKIRINAQLIEATTGHHLWAERYDGELKDVFSLQDRIIKMIVAALAIKLTLGEQQAVARKKTDNIAAYDAFLQGREYIFRLTPEDLARAIPYFEKAIQLDPEYWQAYAALAQTYSDGSWMGLLKSLGMSWIEARAKALQYLQMAMKNPTSLAHQVASSMFLFKRQYEDAIAEAERAIAVDPNDPGAHLMMADALIMADRPAEALGFLKKARRLDPNLPGVYLFVEGMARFCLGQLEETVTLIERALTYNPEVRPLAAPLIAAYAHLGRKQEARTVLQNFLKNWPFSPIPANLRNLMYGFPIKNPKVADRLASGLVMAGMPGGTSGYLKISDQNRLTGNEIKMLLFGRTMIGFEPFTEEQFWVDRTKDGKATLRSLPGSDTGKSWVEGDILTDQWDLFMEGVKLSGYVFRNPDGTPKKKDEYLRLDDFGFISFSPVDSAQQ
ncbi:MAG: tetratricopeptide repeat protein [Pseudomonadota bacterium]